MDPMNVPAKFQVRSFIRSRDNGGYFKTLGSLWIRPRSFFCKIFNGLEIGWMDPANVRAKFEVLSFTRS